ncbi:MAG: prepilin-type N-terminal cleavage/methylation domain-containing protein [Phycisphaerales bacterium]
MSVMRMNEHLIGRLGVGRRAFTLIEVLISVVVLSLGLLGVAAIFPFVLKQQQKATDSVQGVTVARSAADQLTGNVSMTSPDYGVDLTEPAQRRGWRTLTADATWSPQGEWTIPQFVSSFRDLDGIGGLGIEPRTGNMFGGRPSSPSANPDLTYTGFFSMPLSERLWPRPGVANIGAVSGEAKPDGIDPVYVWDFVARRVQSGYSNPVTPSLDPNDAPRYSDDTVQIAVFVRRLDSGIRARVGTIKQTIFSGAAVPVGADPATGIPSYDGLGDRSTPPGRPSYSVPQLAAYAVQTGFDPSRRLLAIATATPEMQRYVSQIGQKLVDDDGFVYTVEKIDDEIAARVRAVPTNAVLVQVSPAMPAKLRNGQAVYSGTVVFTPQVPAAVEVRTVSPWRP